MSLSLSTPARTLDVVIPTHNRWPVCKRALDLWARQPEVHSGAVHVLIVDDGSADGTWEGLQDYRESGKIPGLHLYRHPKPLGPAAARNRALKHLEAPLVFITGDDILAPRGFLHDLLQWHQAHPAMESAVLGRVSWPRALAPTAFMRWLEGPGRFFFFNYADLSPDRPVPPESFYTCNVSLKRELLTQAGSFDERFPHASHEDLELGCRLEEQGMQLYYVPQLRAYHWHPLNADSFAQRIGKMGASARLYWDHVGPRATYGKQILRQGMTLWCTAPPFRRLHGHWASRLSQDDETPKWWWICFAHLSFWMGVAGHLPDAPPQNPSPKDCMPPRD